MQVDGEDVISQTLKRSFQEILDNYAKDVTPDAKRINIRELLENFAKEAGPPPTPAKEAELVPVQTKTLRVEVSKVIDYIQSI